MTAQGLTPGELRQWRKDNADPEKTVAEAVAAEMEDPYHWGEPPPEYSTEL